MRQTGATIADFDGFLNKKVDEISEKPQFEEVYEAVRKYVRDFLPENMMQHFT